MRKRRGGEAPSKINTSKQQLLTRQRSEKSCAKQIVKRAKLIMQVPVKVTTVQSTKEINRILNNETLNDSDIMKMQKFVLYASNEVDTYRFSI